MCDYCRFVISMNGLYVISLIKMISSTPALFMTAAVIPPVENRRYLGFSYRMMGDNAIKKNTPWN